MIIPTFGRPQLVGRAVRSALAQTFKDMEVIVVVDGPDEKTSGTLKHIDDPRLRVIVLPEHVGGSDARNQGVRASRGEWIAFLDDDDEWLPEKLERQLEFAVHSRSVFPVISCKTIARTPTGDFILPRRNPGDAEPVCEYLFVRHSFFQGEGILPIITLLVKKRLLEAVPFQSGLKKYQDWDWVLRVARIEGVRFEIVPEPLAVWNVAEGRRESVGTSCMWQYSLDWLKKSSFLFTPRAYAGFVSTSLVSQASRQGEWKAFVPLLCEMYRFGLPRAMDHLLFLGMWFVPQHMRRKIRSFLKAKD